MNNAYKAEEEKLIPFKTYLLKEEKISESTASDYIKRIITICKENEIDVEHLQTNIDQICFDYTQGSKKDLGQRSHNSYRSAILKFHKFVTKCGGVLSSNNTKPKYHFEVYRIPNEHFGVIKLYDENNNLVATETTLSREHYDTKTVSKDMLLKCLNMMFKYIYDKDNTEIIEVLRTIGVSLTLEGKDIII